LGHDIHSHTSKTILSKYLSIDRPLFQSGFYRQNGKKVITLLNVNCNRKLFFQIWWTIYLKIPLALKWKLCSYYLFIYLSKKTLSITIKDRKWNFYQADWVWDTDKLNSDNHPMAFHKFTTLKKKIFKKFRNGEKVEKNETVTWN